MTSTIEDTDGDNLVLPAFGCPACHERDADRLLIQEDEQHVVCLTCGTAYRMADPIA